MLFKCPKGMFILQKNFRDAFNEEAFCEKYIEEVFDNDLYIVGDISSGILRLKGFDSVNNSPKHFSLMDKYFETAYVIGSPFFVLKRIKTEQDYERISKDEKQSRTDESGFVIHTLEKESFDKESLVLASNPNVHKHVEIDMKKVNSIPKGTLPASLKETAYKEVNEKPQIYTLPKTEIVPENTQTYVSASPDFDPSKKKDFGKNRNNNKKPNKPNGNPNQNNQGNKPNKPNGNPNQGNPNNKPNGNPNQGNPNNKPNGNPNQGNPNNHKKKNKNHHNNNKKPSNEA